MKIALPLAVLVAALAGYWLAPAAPPAVAQDRPAGQFVIVSGDAMLHDDDAREAFRTPVMVRMDTESGRSWKLAFRRSDGQMRMQWVAIDEQR